MEGGIRKEREKERVGREGGRKEEEKEWKRERE